MSAASYSRFYRKLYGYNNSSYYGRYHSRIHGFLDRVRYIKYANGVILVMRENSSLVIKYLRENKANVLQWEVDLSSKDQIELQEKGH